MVSHLWSTDSQYDRTDIVVSTPSCWHRAPKTLVNPYVGRTPGASSTLRRRVSVGSRMGAGHHGDQTMTRTRSFQLPHPSSREGKGLEMELVMHQSTLPT